MKYVVSNQTSKRRMDTTSITDPLWTVEDVAKYFQLKPETIRIMARKGKLPTYKIGQVWRFKKLLIKEQLLKNRAPKGRY